MLDLVHYRIKSLAKLYKMDSFSTFFASVTNPFVPMYYFRDGRTWFIIAGETGLGKSTLMDSLFNTNFESNPAPHTLPNVKLKAHTYELQESNVRLKVRNVTLPFLFTIVFYVVLSSNFVIQLTIVDTVGYGDQINKEDSYNAVVDYIDSQFEAYLQEELKIKRTLHTYHDTRIHVCLYFICPTGHGWVILGYIVHDIDYL